MRIRLNMELPQSESKRLEDLKERTGANTLTEVVRKALSVYDALEKQEADGWKVFLVNKKTKQEMPLLIIK